MFSIVISEKGGAERRETYDRSEINVGRVQGNDLMLPKGNVSKRHARLLYRDGRFIVTDLKSTNGTYVNGRKIAQATIVREGDKIYIGDFVLRIEASGEGAPASPAAGDHAPPPPAASGAPAAFGEDSGEVRAPEALAQASAARAQPSAAPPAPPRPAPIPPQPPRPTTPPQAPPVPQAPSMSPAAPAHPSAPPPMGGPPAFGGGYPPPAMAAPPLAPNAPAPPAPVPLQAAPPPPPALVSPAPPPAPAMPPPMAATSPPAAVPRQATLGYPGSGPSPAASEPPTPAGGSPIPGGMPGAAPQPGFTPSAAPQAAFASAAPPAIAPPPPIPQAMSRPPSMSGAPAAAEPARPPSSASIEPPRLSQSPASSGPIGSAMPPTPMPSSKRVDQPPVDATQAALHRGLLAKLVERTVAAVDLSSLMDGEAPDPAKVALIDRTLREKVATLAGEIPAGLSADVLCAEAKRELTDLGPLGPLLEDEDVEEVQVIRHDHVIALHERRQIATEIAFTSEQAVARAVRRICARSSQPLQPNEVFVERRMESGVRLFGVLPPASGDTHMLVFRKPKRALHSLEDLVRAGTISRAIATLLGHAVALRANILVSGAVNSGATHVLGALAAAGALDDRVIVLQEDDELVFNQPHTVSILIGDTAEEGAKAVRAAIRVRPDRLVVGAFAGHVVAEVVDAVGDGVDGVLAAARAPTLRHLCQRVPADLAATRALHSVETAREWVAAAFDLVIEVARLRDGRHRVMRVSEFSLDQKPGQLGLRDIFTFSVERTAAGGALEGTFHATGEIPHIAEDLARGAPIDLSIFKRATR